MSSSKEWMNVALGRNTKEKMTLHAHYWLVWFGISFRISRSFTFYLCFVRAFFGQLRYVDFQLNWVHFCCLTMCERWGERKRRWKKKNTQDSNYILRRDTIQIFIMRRGKSALSKRHSPRDGVEKRATFPLFTRLISIGAQNNLHCCWCFSFDHPKNQLWFFLDLLFL